MDFPFQWGFGVMARLQNRYIYIWYTTILLRSFSAHEGHLSQPFSLTNWTSRDVRQVIIDMIIALRQWCRCWPETLPSKGGLKTSQDIPILIRRIFLQSSNLHHNTKKRHSGSELVPPRVSWRTPHRCLEVFRLEFAISKNRHEGDLAAGKCWRGLGSPPFCWPCFPF